MTRRFYLPTTTAADVNPAFDAGWAATAQAVRRKAVIVKGTSAITIGSTIDISATSAVKALDRQYVSDPMVAGITIPGIPPTGSGILGQLMVREFATTDNVDGLCMSVRIVSRDGLTVRKDLGGASITSTAVEFISNATCRNKKIDNNWNTSDYVTQAGDRFVFEIGYTTTTGGTTPQAAAKWGENATDLPVNETQTTDGAGWIELQFDVTFEGAVEIAGAVSGSGSPAGTLGNNGAVQGAVSSAATVSGAAAIRASIAGAVSASGVSVGALADLQAMLGAVAGLATPLGSLVDRVPMTGAVSGAGSPAGALAQRIALIGPAAGSSIVLGTLQIVGGVSQVDMVGTSAGLASLVGALTLLRPMAGVVAGNSSALADLQRILEVNGQVHGIGASAARLDQFMALSGDVLSFALVVAELDGLLALEGASFGQASAVGLLSLISGIEVPPCPTFVLLDPSLRDILLAGSLRECLIDTQETEVILIC